MNKTKYIAGVILAAGMALSLVGCGEEKIYGEDDLYQKEGSFYEKESNDLANGIGRTYFSNNVVEEETPYDDGKINGVVKTYYSSGKLREESKYKDGEWVDVTKVYSENGTVINETPIKNGMRNGTQIQYYDTGEIRQKTEYVDDKKVGKREVFKQDGSLAVEVTYVNNNPVDGYEYRTDGSKRPLTNNRYFMLFGLN